MPNVKVSRDSKGRWCCRLYLGRRPDGTPDRPYRTFPDARDEGEAQRLAEEWASHLTAGGAVPSASLAALLEDYVDRRELLGAAPNSVAAWRRYTRRYIAPNVGGACAADLTTRDLTRLMETLLARGGKGGRPLSAGTVVLVHSFLRTAYDDLVSNGLCDSNPMVGVRRPRAARKEAVALSERDAARLDAELRARMAPRVEDEEGAKDAAWAAAMWLSLHTGARRGECLALRRRDVRSAAGQIHVCGNVVEARGGPPARAGETKGRRSRNVSVTADVVDAIRALCDMQDRVWGPLPADAPLVYLGGGYARPSSASRAFARLRDELRLPREATFHSLRHTHATLMLFAGIDLKTVSERLGHAKVSTTGEIYAHTERPRDAAAADVLERALARV